MFKRKGSVLIIALILLFIVGSACAVEEENGVIVSNANELVSALNDPTVMRVVFKTSITTTTSIFVTKELDLNGNNWTIADGTVTLPEYVSVYGGKTITVSQEATLLAYGVPSAGAIRVKGTMRRMVYFSIDCASGTVDSISYKSGGKDSGTGIKNAPVTNGSVGLMIATDANANAKEVSYITVNSVRYKAGTKINAYSKIYKIVLIVSEEKTQTIEYTSLDAARTLSGAQREGYIFEGWIAEGSDTPEKIVVIPEGSTGNMTFTAAWTEDPDAKKEEDKLSGFSGRGGRPGSFPGRKGDASKAEATLLDETDIVDEEPGETLDAQNGANDQLGPDGMTAVEERPRGKRVSVASEKTRTSFEQSAPKTEDVGLTIEQDPMEKIRLYVIGGSSILVAIVFIILLNRSKRKNGRF